MDLDFPQNSTLLHFLRIGMHTRRSGLKNYVMQSNTIFWIPFVIATENNERLRNNRANETLPVLILGPNLFNREENGFIQASTSSREVCIIAV